MESHAWDMAGISIHTLVLCGTLRPSGPITEASLDDLTGWSPLLIQVMKYPGRYFNPRIQLKGAFQSFLLTR
jgi:hypothetical protein